MTVLTKTTPTNSGATTTYASVGSTDTVNIDQMGPTGCYLEINNGNASSNSMTFTDAGATPSGNSLASGTYPGSVTNATSKVFKLYRRQANKTTGNITITNSVTSSVGYKLYPF